jgi:hypothetical protein
LTPAAYAATLKPESVQAWDRYVAAAEAKLAKKVQENATFLWVDESAERKRSVREGEIVVAETYSGVSKKAPSALIHDWTGAAFVEGANIGVVMSVVRDYADYKEYYRPTVVTSKTISQTPYQDQFSFLAVNQALLVRTALETECQSVYTQVNDKRWYAETKSTRIQEIEDYGRSNEHRLPVGEGGGYLWRMASITRFEERDGGVYVELEVLALSRDVPASLRLFIDPIVRRVSRNSLSESLRQTGQAVNERVVANEGFSKVAGDEVQSSANGRRESHATSILGIAAVNQ